MTFIKEQNIFLEQPLTTQEEVFQFLADQAVALEIASDRQEVYDKLLEREQEGTTGMMDGFAIPHAKAATITEPALIIVRLKQGIDWQSLDGSLSAFIIALFIPAAEAGTSHLKLLSSVARLLMREEVTTQLKAAQNQAAIAAILNERLSEV